MGGWSPLSILFLCTLHGVNVRSQGPGQAVTVPCGETGLTPVSPQYYLFSSGTSLRDVCTDFSNDDDVVIQPDTTIPQLNGHYRLPNFDASDTFNITCIRQPCQGDLTAGNCDQLLIKLISKIRKKGTINVEYDPAGGNEPVDVVVQYGPEGLIYVDDDGLMLNTSIPLVVDSDTNVNVEMRVSSPTVNVNDINVCEIPLDPEWRPQSMTFNRSSSISITSFNNVNCIPATIGSTNFYQFPLRFTDDRTRLTARRIKVILGNDCNRGNLIASETLDIIGINVFYPTTVMPTPTSIPTPTPTVKPSPSPFDSTSSNIGALLIALIVLASLIIIIIFLAIILIIIWAKRKNRNNGDTGGEGNCALPNFEERNGLSIGSHCGDRVKMATSSGKEQGGEEHDGNGLSLQRIKTLLREEDFPSDKAEDLGEYLGITAGRISTFKMDSGNNPDRLLSNIIMEWLNNDVNTSGDKLANAVKYCGHSLTANKIREIFSDGGDIETTQPNLEERNNTDSDLVTVSSNNNLSTDGLVTVSSNNSNWSTDHLVPGSVSSIAIGNGHEQDKDLCPSLSEPPGYSFKGQTGDNMKHDKIKKARSWHDKLFRSKRKGTVSSQPPNDASISEKLTQLFDKVDDVSSRLQSVDSNTTYCRETLTQNSSMLEENGAVLRHINERVEDGRLADNQQ